MTPYTITFTDPNRNATTTNQRKACVDTTSINYNKYNYYYKYTEKIEMYGDNRRKL